MNIPEILLNGLIVSIAWFVAGGMLYMNPVVAKIYKKYSEHQSMKKWPTQKKYMLNMYVLAILIPSIIASFAYAFLTPISIVNFALLLIGIRMIPRLFDMYMQTCYPNKLLIIELINGSLLSLLAACLFSLL